MIRWMWWQMMLRERARGRISGSRLKGDLEDSFFSFPFLFLSLNQSHMICKDKLAILNKTKGGGGRLLQVCIFPPSRSSQEVGTYRVL